MKQYGYSRCMDKEEKWYPEEKEDRYFEKDDDYFDKKEKCFDKKEKCFDKEDDYFEEEKCQCKKQRREKECERKERCKVVVEPTVYCKEEKSFRHCVKHIVPVVCKEVENHHLLKKKIVMIMVVAMKTGVNLLDVDVAVNVNANTIVKTIVIANNLLSYSI